jgi:hypothetical protein
MTQVHLVASFNSKRSYLCSRNLERKTGYTIGYILSRFIESVFPQKARKHSTSQLQLSVDIRSGSTLMGFKRGASRGFVKFHATILLD